MTDRIHSFTVVLDKDYREDDVEAIQTALQMVRGVATVAAHVADLTTHMAEQRALMQLRERMQDVLWPKTV